MINRYNSQGIFLLVIFAMATILGCSTTEDQLTPVTVRLKWLHQSQFAGHYVAESNGYYAREGLDVAILPYEDGHTAVEDVANKEVLFGVASADEVLLARAEGKSIKSVAVIYKINPVCAYALAESGITKPQDFIGKRVGLETASPQVVSLYEAVLSELDIDRTQIIEVPIGFDASELLAGEVDVSTGYIINEPHQAIEAGKEVNIILFADYGANVYADTLIVHEDTLRESPELVKKFVKATLEGWEYAIEYPEETAGVVLQYAPRSTRSHELYMLKQSTPLINPGDSHIGEMNPEKWKLTHTILVRQKLLPENSSWEDAFDTSVTEAIYSSHEQ